ncbi:MAG: hypothetical protein AAF236_17580 [Verrucomicrobiota bacterium]
MFGSSPIVRFCLFAILGAGGVVGYSYTVGQNSAIGITTMTVVDTIREEVTSRLGDLNLPSLPKSTEPVAKDDQGLALDACMKSLFLNRGGYHFSVSKWGARPVPYQFEGLELIGPRSVSLNDADRRNGIDKRVDYAIHVDAYRQFSTDEGWGDWRFNQPPNLANISLMRQDGEWKVASSPKKSYSYILR